MNQFFTIYAFELKSYFKNKIFVGVTIFVVLVLAVVISFPRIKLLFTGSGNDTETTQDGDAGTDTNDVGDVLLISTQDEALSAGLKEAFTAAFSDYNVQVTTLGEEEIKKQVQDKLAECAFVFRDAADYTYYVNNLSMYDRNTEIANSILTSYIQAEKLTAAGLSPEQTIDVMSVQVNGKTETIGKDQMSNFFYTYIMIFALYMVILLYGQMVASSVANEKSSRAMEVLITSAKPVNMMFGKVLAACTAGLIQLVCFFGSASLFYNLNKNYWGENFFIESIFAVPGHLIGFMVLFFLLGFLLYAFMYGAVGSTADKMEDINTSTMPIQLCFIAAFFVVVFSMGGGDVDTLLMKVCSYIPLTSPMAMFTRIAMTTVPAVEIIISVAILVVSCCAIGIVSARIYKVGVLHYGAKMKMGTMIKSVLTQK